MCPELKFPVQDCFKITSIGSWHCDRGRGYGVYGAEGSLGRSFLTKYIEKMMSRKGKSREIKNDQFRIVNVKADLVSARGGF